MNKITKISTILWRTFTAKITCFHLTSQYETLILHSATCMVHAATPNITNLPHWYITKLYCHCHFNIYLDSLSVTWINYISWSYFIRVETVAKKIQRRLPVLSDAERKMKNELKSMEDKIKDFRISIQQVWVLFCYRMETDSCVYQFYSFNSFNACK